MQITPDQKRRYQQKLRRIRRKLSSYAAVYQTPHLFDVPENSLVNRDRSIGFFPKTQTVWKDLSHFTSAPHITNGIHSVWHRRLPIEFELSRDRSKTLLVVFHGALEHYALLPIFSGAQVTSDLDVARVSFTDPSLYLSPTLPLAWFAGSYAQPDLQTAISLLVRKLARSVGATRIIFFGSSGGGFASLIQAATNPGSTAVVANAQTDILRYHQQHVRNYLQLAWNDDRDKFIESVEFSALRAFRESENRPKVVYMQNSTDTFHIEGHLNPFLNSCQVASDAYLLVGNWGQGHVPPPKNIMHGALQAVVQNNYSELNHLGFERSYCENPS